MEVLKLAREMGLLKMGTVALDGTKIHANASRHSALSYEHAGKIEAQLKAEVTELLAKAEAADQSDAPDGMSLPEELARRKTRLAKLADARAKIEARAKERFEREQAEYSGQTCGAEGEGRSHRQEAQRQTDAAAGRRSAADGSDQPDRRRVAHHGGGGRRVRAVLQRPGGGGGGQPAVVATDVVQAANDKQQLEPMVEKLKALPEELGQVETLLADNGYFSAANVTTCEAANIVPLIATGREVHHPSLAERFAAVPTAPQDPTPVQSMAHRLKTAEGKKLYALRKQIPEPVFGIIKSVLGFRQFLLRGSNCVRGEWSFL